LSPETREKVSKHSVSAGELAGLFALFPKLREKSRAKTGHNYPIVLIQQAGLDGFWVQVLEKEGVSKTTREFILR